MKISGLGWKQLIAISSSNAFSLLPLFFFSAFPHGILFFKIIDKHPFVLQRRCTSLLTVVFLATMLCSKFITSQIKQTKFLRCYLNFRSYASLSRHDQRKSNLSAFVAQFVICRSCLCNNIIPRSSFKLKIPGNGRLIAFYNAEAKG